MRRTSYLQLAYCLTAIGLASVVVLNQRGYQDAWILQDILVPTLVYVLVFAIIVVRVRDDRLLPFLCSSFVIVLNAIPNLKYEVFYGTYDSAAHYGFLSNLLRMGHVPETGVYAGYYSGNPGMHILLASVSLVLGISADAAVRLLTSTIFGVIPFMIYFVTKGLEKDVRRGILIASGLPAVPGYILLGGTFGDALYFVFLCVLIGGILSRSNPSRAYTLILLVLGYGLVFSHPVTTLVLLLTLTVLLLLLTLRPIENAGASTSAVRRVFLVLAVSWASQAMFKAGFVLEDLVAIGQWILEELSLGVTMVGIPERVGQIPLFAQVSVFLVNHIGDLVIGIFSLLGLLTLLKFRAQCRYAYNRIYIPLVLLEVGLATLLLLQVAYGVFEYRRSIAYGMMFQPFFSGLVLWHINNRVKIRRLRLTLITVVLFLSISISLIQLFPYQPMVPRANVLSKTLPGNEYLYDLRMVNSVYQVACINFAQRFSSGDSRIASDSTTKWQIQGFAADSFSSRHIYWSPLDTKVTADWNLFLLHYDGPAGPLSEKVEYRTAERVQMFQDDLGNLVYHNGLSFVIQR